MEKKMETTIQFYEGYIYPLGFYRDKEKKGETTTMCRYWDDLPHKLIPHCVITMIMLGAK